MKKPDCRSGERRMTGQWTQPTPCSLWNVRDLVNHMVAALRWTPWLISGAPAQEAGSRFDGDLLGDEDDLDPDLVREVAYRYRNDRPCLPAG